MDELINELQNEIEELKAALEAKDALEAVYAARLTQVEEIRQMKFAKVYRAASIRMGKGDPFDSVRRELKPQERIRVWIGEYIYKENCTEIRGWAADPGADTEYLRVRAADGSLVPHLMRRMARPDVNSTLSLMKDRKCGFVLRLENDFSAPLPYTLEIESASGIERIPLVIEPDREKRIADWQAALAGKKAPSDGPLIAYDDWAYAKRITDVEMKRQSETAFSRAPLFSIVVPLYNTPETFLKDLLASVLAQTYGNWELCLADGSPEEGLEEAVKRIAGGESRIRYRKLERNGGISGNTNAAIEMAEGEFIVFADHDDVLTPDALYETAKVLNEEGEADLIYSDEDKMTKDGSYLYDPFFKPDFDPVLLTSYNYFTHLVAVRKTLVERAGALDSTYDGAQDYDFVLRMSESAGRVAHIPRSLYHWRAHELSTAGNSESKSYAYENGRKALEEHLKRQGLKGTVEIGAYTGRYEVTYEPSEDFRVSVIRVPLKGGSPAALNREAKDADSPFLFFISERFKGNAEETARKLAGFFALPDVGAAGGRVSGQNGRIRSAGWMIGVKGLAAPAFADLSTEVFSYGGYANLTHSVSALSAECLLTRKETFEELGGFDERFRADLFDADYGLRLMRNGKRSVICPQAETVLATEETAFAAENLQRADREYFQKKWQPLIEKGDPYFNPNLDLNRSDFALKGQYI